MFHVKHFKVVTNETVRLFSVANSRYDGYRYISNISKRFRFGHFTLRYRNYALRNVIKAPF